MIKSCKNPQKTVYMIFGLQRSCGGINEPLQTQKTLYVKLIDFSTSWCIPRIINSTTSASLYTSSKNPGPKTRCTSIAAPITSPGSSFISSTKYQTSYLRVLCAWSGSYSSHNPLAFECVKFFLSWIKFLLFSFLTFNPTLITNKDYKPCLVVEFPSTYHDSHDARELDNKKLHLLTLAGVPLIYSRIKDFGLLHLYSQNQEVIFNLFTGEKRENAKALIKTHIPHFKK